MSLHRILLYPFRYIKRIIFFIILRMRLKSISLHSIIIYPFIINGGNNISIGKRSCISKYSWLAALPLTGAGQCLLKIGDDCAIGHFNHIYCTKSIILENGVLTADKVYISDNLHGYNDIHTYIKDQPIVQNGEVVIGEGSWLGENVCVLGSKIGKHCVIGANSVVTKNIPDYCVAVGAPAKIIKRYDFTTQSWRKTNPQGEFID